MEDKEDVTRTMAQAGLIKTRVIAGEMIISFAVIVTAMNKMHLLLM